MTQEGAISWIYMASWEHSLLGPQLCGAREIREVQLDLGRSRAGLALRADAGATALSINTNIHERDVHGQLRADRRQRK